MQAKLRKKEYDIKHIQEERDWENKVLQILIKDSLYINDNGVPSSNPEPVNEELCAVVGGEKTRTNNK